MPRLVRLISVSPITRCEMTSLFTKHFPLLAPCGLLCFCLGCASDDDVEPLDTTPPPAAESTDYDQTESDDDAMAPPPSEETRDNDTAFDNSDENDGIVEGGEDVTEVEPKN